MKTGLNVLVGLIGLFFAAMWLQWMLDPAAMGTQWGLTANSVVGTNNLRGDIGGLFLAAAVFCGLYFRGGAAWLHAASVAMACVIVGRVSGLVLDGFDPQSAASAVIEAVFIAVFQLAARARAD